MGEPKLELAKRKEMLLSCAGVRAAAGRVQVRWDTESTATPMGQLAYFIEFPALTGPRSRRPESRPLSYGSPDAPGKAEVPGTWSLSIL
ncbi:MAG: transposase, partial [Betaproteobacteria bacterium]|nr:transposase [Betaproteobacteria bacterium]